jgi:spore coat polysaccharide biosynthesis predicted glycosyltransferase SpsG
VLFRAPAGPRRGFGHVVRCLSLARALDVRPLLALRGGVRVRHAALALGADLLASPTLRSMRAFRPDLLVVDDPIAADARRWIRAARRAGAIVVTLHDLGLGCHESDLAIDGSLARVRIGARAAQALTGPRFAVLDPALRSHTRRRQHQGGGFNRTVVIALGGGPHARRAAAIARSIVAIDRRAVVHIASGFVSGPPKGGLTRVRWVGPLRRLAPELARASVAIVGGGVSLYEACALGVPTVTVPVVKGQVPTVLAFSRSRAAWALPYRSTPRVAANAALGLLADRHLRTALARRCRNVIDGHGAMRAARAVTALADKRGR